MHASKLNLLCLLQVVEDRRASSFAFDPSSGSILTSAAQDEQADSGLNVLDETTEQTLHSDNGASAAAPELQFTPQSAHAKFIGKMLRSDLAAEVHLNTALPLQSLTQTCKRILHVDLQMAAVGLFKGRRALAAGNRPDLDFFKVHCWISCSSSEIRPGSASSHQDLTVYHLAILCDNFTSTWGDHTQGLPRSASLHCNFQCTVPKQLGMFLILMPELR